MQYRKNIETQTLKEEGWKIEPPSMLTGKPNPSTTSNTEEPKEERYK